MHFPTPRPKNDDERILPLINVVFLLLIFFMLAGQLAATDPFEIAPPRSASDGEAAIEDLVVQLGADGRLALDGKIMDEAALEAAIVERIKGGRAGQVHLKADGRAEATRVVEVMERLRRAGVERLKLLTQPEGR